MSASRSSLSIFFSRRAGAGCLATDGPGYDSESALFFGSVPFLGLNPTTQHAQCLRKPCNVSAPSMPPAGVTATPARNRRGAGAL